MNMLLHTPLHIVEIDKDQPNEKNQAYLSRFAIARESGTLIYIFAETQRPAEE